MGLQWIISLRIYTPEVYKTLFRDWSESDAVQSSAGKDVLLLQYGIYPFWVKFRHRSNLSTVHVLSRSSAGVILE